jgi:hypothetical protein
MMELKHCVLVLFITAPLALGSSCAENEDREQGPTEEEIQQVATELCEQTVECGSIPNDVTLEECIANRVGTYQDSPECVSHYYFDECLTTQTCEEIERLDRLHIGDCLDERDEADRVECDPF